MRALPTADRKRLESAVLAARRASESACRSAIDALGVFADRRPDHLDTHQTALRKGLRAKWRQLDLDRELLVAQCAYEQWHRLLFARFLAENNILLHPRYEAPVTLQDCEDLADELGEPDAWSVAAQFASEILPGIFRLDDPCVRLRLAPEGRHALEQILDGLPAETFAADDALGWVYQFWQKDKKDEVNASERKIGGVDLGPVTQLFTENYMVRFLLENSLGAWWAARHPESPLVGSFDYLRFDDDGKPAAGAFDGWPDRVAEVTVMDPCCGSGHFLVEAFSMLWQMRAEEEGLSPISAQDAVLQDNLFGLEIDSRCVQIATFSLALKSWTAGGNWRKIPLPNLACSGSIVKTPSHEWKALAANDSRLEGALSRLHALFRNADSLGSLLDPRNPIYSTGPTDSQIALDSVEWSDLALVLDSALSAEAEDPAITVLGAEAVGVARAAHFLARSYTLSATNVPYLRRAHQSEFLAEFCAAMYPDARHDLALAMLDRISRSATSVACVLPHSWLFLSWNRGFRTRWLKENTWNFLAHLGSGAFRSVSGEVVNVVLGVWTNSPPAKSASIGVLDLDQLKGVDAKQSALQDHDLARVSQIQQLNNPDAKVSFEDIANHPLLAERASGYAGIQSGDYPRFGRLFWEIPWPSKGWVFQQSTVRSTDFYSGREHIFKWEHGRGEFVDFVRSRLGPGKEGAWIRGANFSGRRGVAVSSMSSLPVTLYTGELFDNNTAVILPKDEADLPAIWAFASSPEFRTAVRRIDTSIKVTNSTFVKVPFDVEYWRTVADELGPLPGPWSDDPTQWLFEGDPSSCTSPLQVVVGRLLGYRWPEHVDDRKLDSSLDNDGVMCLPAVAGEARASDRVQQLLAIAYGDAWSPARLKELLGRVGSKKNLAEWLRDDFFKHHCALFLNRPFVWHIWDGLTDGFSALVNYHMLDRKSLAKLTYSYLGQDWVERQRAEIRDEVAGAENRLAAAMELKRKLELILDGEQPYDIYVRWKELHDQSIGWEPDLNDGVRLNIRPFVTAGVLRAPFNIHWKKDRGKNPDGSERHNDVHLSLAEKQEARRKVGRT